MPGKLVGLTFGRMAYDTYTDDRGRFEFRSASIKPGPDALKIETVSKPVELAPSPLRNVQLKLLQ